MKAYETSLNKLITKYAQKKAEWYSHHMIAISKGIINGISYMHDKGIVYGMDNVDSQGFKNEQYSYRDSWQRLYPNYHGLCNSKCNARELQKGQTVQKLGAGFLLDCSTDYHIDIQVTTIPDLAPEILACTEKQLKFHHLLSEATDMYSYAILQVF